MATTPTSTTARPEVELQPDNYTGLSVMKAYRRPISIRMRADLLEALDELGEEMTYGRSRLVEIAVERFLTELVLPPADPDHPGVLP